METNPYAYDTTVQWIPQQNQFYAGSYVSPRTGQQEVLQKQRPQPVSRNKKPRPPEKMPKARALALAHTLKKWLTVASIIGFGTFSGLVAFHQVGTTTTQTNQTSSSSTQNTSATNSSSQNNNGFLNQGGNNFGSNNTSQGSTSGSSSSSSSAVSGTHTS